MWEELKDKQDKWGFTFRQCIFPGCKYQELLGGNRDQEECLGVVVGSEDCYRVFRPFIEKIILDYHGFLTEPPPQLLSSLPSSSGLDLPLAIAHFPPSDTPCVLSSTISLSRNLSSYPFPPGLSRD